MKNSTILLCFLLLASAGHAQRFPSRLQFAVQKIQHNVLDTFDVLFSFDTTTNETVELVPAFENLDVIGEPRSSHQKVILTRGALSDTFKLKRWAYTVKARTVGNAAVRAILVVHPGLRYEATPITCKISAGNKIPRRTYDRGFLGLSSFYVNTGESFSTDQKFVIATGPVFHANRDITLRPGNIDSDWLQTSKVHALIQSKVRSGNPEFIRTRIPRYYNTIDDTVGLRHSIDSLYRTVDSQIRFGTFFYPLKSWEQVIDNDNIANDAISWRESYDCIMYLRKEGFSMKKKVELYFGILFEDENQWKLMQKRMRSRGYAIVTAYDSNYTRPYLLNVSKFYFPDLKTIHDAAAEVRTELRRFDLYQGLRYTGIGVRGRPH